MEARENHRRAWNRNDEGKLKRQKKKQLSSIGEKGISRRNSHSAERAVKHWKESFEFNKYEALGKLTEGRLKECVEYWSLRNLKWKFQMTIKSSGEGVPKE